MKVTFHLLFISWTHLLLLLLLLLQMESDANKLGRSFSSCFCSSSFDKAKGQKSTLLITLTGTSQTPAASMKPAAVECWWWMNSLWCAITLFYFVHKHILSFNITLYMRLSGEDKNMCPCDMNSSLTHTAVMQATFFSSPSDIFPVSLTKNQVVTLVFLKFRVTRNLYPMMITSYQVVWRTAGWTLYSHGWISQQ